MYYICKQNYTQNHVKNNKTVPTVQQHPKKTSYIYHNIQVIRQNDLTIY